MSKPEQQIIEALQKEVARIAAENLAQQFILTCFFQRLGQAIPGSKITILQALDDAADHAERFSIASGKEAGHLPETLRIVEQMRLMLIGKDKPQREV